MTAVGIFGFGRTGRNLFRILQDRSDMRVAAVADIAEPASLAYLLKFDTLLGRFPGEVSVDGGRLLVDGRRIALFAGKDRPPVPDWGSLGVHTVFEATSRDVTRAQAETHLRAGAQRVILMAPPAEPADVTLVGGVNDDVISSSQRVVSTATATVQGLAPLLKILDDAFTTRRTFFTAVHSYTSAHNLADVPAPDKRRGRAAAENIIPQESRSRPILAEIFPHLATRVTGYAMNVPVSNGSAVDVVTWHEKPVTKESVNEALRAAAAESRWSDVLCYETEPIVSSDVARSRHSATFDSLATMVLGGRVSKTLAWFDSSYGHANRAIELVARYAAAEGRA